eukprot:3699101-Pleurochrysis_carterae.AAC.2
MISLCSKAQETANIDDAEADDKEPGVNKEEPVDVEAVEEEEAEELGECINVDEDEAVQAADADKEEGKTPVSAVAEGMKRDMGYYGVHHGMFGIIFYKTLDGRPASISKTYSLSICMPNYILSI